jgi:hypothetical protein
MSTDTITQAERVAQAEVMSADILADYRIRYDAANTRAEWTQEVLRFHKRRGAFWSYALTVGATDHGYVAISGLTFSEALVRFGITQADGSALKGTQAPKRDYLAYKVLAAIRPALNNTDAPLDPADRAAWALWSSVDKVVRGGMADDALKAANASVLAVRGEASAQETGTLQYADPFSDAAWPALELEFSTRLALLVQAVGRAGKQREANKAALDAVKDEVKSAVSEATEQGAASQHVREDVSSSEGTREMATGADRPNEAAPALVTFQSMLEALEADLKFLSKDGKSPLSVKQREDIYKVVRLYTFAK